MKKFESTWRDGYRFFERCFDTELGRSTVSEIDLPYEWYEPSSTGLYTYILDDSIKLERKQGKAKQGREHYGFTDPMYRNIRDNYWGADAYNLEPRVWYLDIETRVGTCSTGFPVPEHALEPISLMQFYDNKEGVMIVLGVKEWSGRDNYTFDYPVKYVKCRDEVHMLESFLAIYGKFDPLIVYAWNGLGFDFPYIYNRMKRLGLQTNRLSNHGKVTYSEGEYQGKTEFSFSADGHFWVDLMDVYKKFTFHPMSSYSLDSVAEYELNENKVDHSSFSSFEDFYNNGYDEFVYYGIKDTYLIRRIDEAKNFTVLMNMISEKMGVQISDSMGTVKPWSQYIANKSMLNRRVMPMRQEHGDSNVVGGFVRDPVKGKHKWVISLDINSMYPLLGMVGFNMSPETYIPKYKLPPELRDIVLAFFNDQDESARLKLTPDIWAKVSELLREHNLSLGINGAAFTKEKIGLIPEMVQEIYDSRKKAKKTMIAYEQRKVLIEQILKERG